MAAFVNHPTLFHFISPQRLATWAGRRAGSPVSVSLGTPPHYLCSGKSSTSDYRVYAGRSMRCPLTGWKDTERKPLGLLYIGVTHTTNKCRNSDPQTSESMDQYYDNCCVRSTCTLYSCCWRCPFPQSAPVLLSMPDPQGVYWPCLFSLYIVCSMILRFKHDAVNTKRCHGYPRVLTL